MYVNNFIFFIKKLLTYQLNVFLMSLNHKLLLLTYSVKHDILTLFLI